MAYEDQASCQRLAGDENVGASDGRPRPRPRGPDLTGLSGVLGIEGNGLEPQPVDAGMVLGLARALGGTVAQLVDHDGGQAEILRGVAPETAKNARVAFEDGDHGIGVEQEPHPNRSPISGRSYSGGSLLGRRREIRVHRPRHGIEPVPSAFDRLQHHTIALATDADLIGVEAEGLGQTDSLAATRPEDLCGIHDDAPACLIYRIDIYATLDDFARTHRIAWTAAGLSSR